MSMSPLRGLDNPPLASKSGESHIWADYVELLCLANIDRELSRDDMCDRVLERQDLGEVQEFAEEIGAAEYDRLFGYMRDEELSFLLGEAAEPVALEERAEKRQDRNEQQIDQWFRHLEYRGAAFGDFYPFAANAGVVHCREGFESDPRCRLYLFLLVCSSLKYVDQGRRDDWTSRFEIVSMVALKNYLPRAGKVSFVAKNRLNQGNYRCSAYKKVQFLAKQIGEPVAAGCRGEDFNPHDVGDHGLDIVGRVPLGDRARGQLLLFGQCGCGKQWTDKQLEAHAIRWHHYIEFKCPPTNVVFIPYCFRDLDGRWYSPLAVEECILIDRLRLVHLLRDKLQLLHRIHPYVGLVNEVMSYRESIL